MDYVLAMITIIVGSLALACFGLALYVINLGVSALMAQ
jgi:hypothetical protein